MNLLKYTLLFAVLFSCGATQAQMGITISQVNPNGEIGQHFNKAVGVSLYTTFDERKWRVRAGIFYTRLAPPLDTVPVYLVSSVGSTSTVVPGYLVNHSMRLGYLFVDYSYRVLKVKHLNLYLGAGMMVGVAHVAYEREFEAILTENVSRDMLIGGCKAFSLLNYKINRHFDVFGEAGINLAVDKKYTSLKHYTFGLGFAYTIKPGK